MRSKLDAQVSGTSQPAPASTGLPSTAQAVNSSGSGGSIYDILAADRAFALSSARETNEFNAAEAAKARAWQKEMMTHSHQWEVEDLVKAGLNPVLSANSGANAYNSAVASGVKPDTPSGANAIANIMAAAMSAGAMVQVAQINAQSASNVAKIQGGNQIDYGTLMSMSNEKIQTGHDETSRGNSIIGLLGTLGLGLLSSAFRKSASKYY